MIRLDVEKITMCRLHGGNLALAQIQKELRKAVRREEKEEMGRDSGGRTLGLRCEQVEGGF